MATRGDFANLQHFTYEEFKHPELMNPLFLAFLDNVRHLFGKPLVITSDARTPEENTAASGSSTSSLHLVGRAVDLRWSFSDSDLYRFVGSAIALGVRASERVELELVHSLRDRHVHLGTFPDPKHPNTLIVSAD